ncbi:MAG: LCP family protein, partial [Clostridia bacterium]|nr:LCP family protein [Clostridia bacterium]
MSTKKKIILLSSIAAGVVILGVVIALVIGSLGTGSAFRNGGSCGGNPQQNAEATEEAITTPDPNGIIITTDDPVAVPTNDNGEATAAPTADAEPTKAPVDPYEDLVEQADTSMMKDIVNILLVGVDYSTERETWDGKKEWHSDVMMVLAVNFDENRADLISLPRDTYANIPDVKGIYKLNASLNCGGGLYNKDGSFNPKGLEKVCDAAEWMLGGIKVDYYYAVTMTSLKDLVDLCGGLEYDMDISFKIQGRSYEKGMQHVNGQGFLDYCRVRKGTNGLPSSEQGDANRVNRQKRMLVALFRQMQVDQLITKIPQIIETFDGDLFTNCTPAQTAALAVFAYNLDANNIGMYSMGGTTQSLFQWNFCFTDQANRVDIINKVYGVKVKQYPKYTLKYGRYTWCDLLYDHYRELLDPLTKYVQKLIDEDDLLPEFTPSPVPTDTPSPTPSQTPTVKPSQTPTVKPTQTPTVKPTQSPTPTPSEKPTEEPTPTEKPTDTPEPPPTEKPTEEPTPDPTPEPTNEGANGTVMNMRARVTVYSDQNQVRQYSAEQRELFEEYKETITELERVKKEADKEAKKARNGSNNSLNSV